MSDAPAIKPTPLATVDVAGVVATLAPAELDAFVTELPKERVPEWAVRLKEFGDRSDKMGKVLDARMTLDGLKEWTDPVDDTTYEFAGARGNRELKDGEGLYKELVQGLIDLALLSPETAVRVANAVLPMRRVTTIDALNKVEREYPKVKRIIRDFTKRKPAGPPHLRVKKDEDDD